MAEFCFDSYDALVSNAEISGLESEKWLAVKDMDPWDPAAAREQCAQAVRRISWLWLRYPEHYLASFSTHISRSGHT
jgi:hypothetical protein|eukprot:COSAG02_NODE_441_length_22281_cov_6.119556_25_plen_77_part_00